MSKRPRFKSHFRVEVRSAELVVAASESRAVTLHGRLLPRIVPWVDGVRSVAEIAAAAGEPVTPLDAVFGIGLLQREGLIEEAGTAFEPWRSAFAEAAGARANPSGRAAVAAGGGFAAQPLESALQSLGIEIAEPAQLTLVLTGDYLCPGIARDGPWMPVKAAGAEIWFGPVCGCATGACWRCLAERIAEWRRAEAGDLLRPSAPLPAALLDLALRLAAIEAFRYLSGAAGPPALFTFDWARMRLDRHAVVCSCAAVQPAPPIERLEARPPGAAETVLARFGHLSSPITGIVGRLEPYGLEAAGVAAACAAPYVLLGRRRTTSGKGATRAEAAASALCEAVERYSGAFHPADERLTATYRKMGADAVHPGSLLHFSAGQYRRRETSNRHARPEQWVPAPFDEERAIEWSPAWSVSCRRRRWVPSAYCYYGCPLPPDHRFCAPDSNGCAAGLSRQEAALSGLVELIERDAVALWWYNRVPRAAIMPESLGGRAQAFAGHYGSLGRSLRLFDITSDLGVPVFAAISWRPHCPRELTLGFGASFDPCDAAARALTEMHQFLETDGTAKVRCLLGEGPSGSEFLFGSPCVDFAPPAGAVNHADALIDRLRTAGLELLVLDQTRAGTRMPVVKAIVPGLRHFWPRLGPGRLYDVPVAMGWRSAPSSEAQLNHTPFFC